MRRLPRTPTAAAKRAVLLILALWALPAGSCDHTRLRGRIVASPAEARVGETVQLDLELPAELARVYWVQWEVSPSARLVYEKVSDTEDTPSYSTRDRRATFTATTPGEYVISTYGIFRQTNYQPITEITLAVRPGR